TGETREVTDPATLPPPVPPLPISRTSNPSLQVVTAQPVLIAQPQSSPPSASYDEDDDDIGAKTIPAAMLPGGLFAPPELIAARARGELPPAGLESTPASPM